MNKNNSNQKMAIEIDYSELSYGLTDENGNVIKPLIMIIVHPESCFILGSHIASPNSDYLKEFLDKILEVIKNSPFLPGTILVKKKNLFDLLKKYLKESGIEIEMAKRTKAVESVKREIGKIM